MFFSKLKTSLIIFACHLNATTTVPEGSTTNQPSTLEAGVETLGKIMRPEDIGVGFDFLKMALNLFGSTIEIEKAKLTENLNALNLWLKTELIPNKNLFHEEEKLGKVVFALLSLDQTRPKTSPFSKTFNIEPFKKEIVPLLKKDASLSQEINSTIANLDDKMKLLKTRVEESMATLFNSSQTNNSTAKEPDTKPLAEKSSTSDNPQNTNPDKPNTSPLEAELEKLIAEYNQLTMGNTNAILDPNSPSTLITKLAIEAFMQLNNAFSNYSNFDQGMPTFEIQPDGFCLDKSQCYKHVEITGSVFCKEHGQKAFTLPEGFPSNGLQKLGLTSPLSNEKAFQIAYNWYNKVRSNKRAMIELIETMFKKGLAEASNCNEKLNLTKDFNTKGAVLFANCKMLCDPFFKGFSLYAMPKFMTKLTFFYPSEEEAIALADSIKIPVKPNLPTAIPSTTALTRTSIVFQASKSPQIPPTGISGKTRHAKPSSATGKSQR